MPWSSNAKLPKEWSRTSVWSWIAARDVTWQLLVPAHTGSALTLNFRGLEPAGWQICLLCFPLQAAFPRSSNATALMAWEQDDCIISGSHQITLYEIFNYVISIILQSLFCLLCICWFLVQIGAKIHFADETKWVFLPIGEKKFILLGGDSDLNI